MSKIFAIVIPIFSIIITTIFIVFSQSNMKKETTKKFSLILLGLGILLFLGIYIFLSNGIDLSN